MSELPRINKAAHDEETSSCCLFSSQGNQKRLSAYRKADNIICSVLFGDIPIN